MGVGKKKLPMFIPMSACHYVRSQQQRVSVMKMTKDEAFKDFDLNKDFELHALTTSHGDFTDETSKYRQVLIRVFTDDATNQVVYECDISRSDDNSGIDEFASWALREQNVQFCRKEARAVMSGIFDLSYAWCDDKENSVIGNSVYYRFETHDLATNFLIELMTKHNAQR